MIAENASTPSVHTNKSKHQQCTQLAQQQFTVGTAVTLK